MIKYCILSVCIALLITNSLKVKAQCDDKLVDKVISKSGNEALFIREFILKPGSLNKKKKDKNPTFSAKYDVRLNRGIIYRFIIETEEKNMAPAFLQLRKNNLALASTYDTENQYDIGSFDYLCDENGQYQVLLSFVGENTGCAAGGMFAIIQDSLTVHSIMDSTEIKNVLYTGIDNYIDIAASNISGGSLDVTISRGKIAEESGLYKIRVEEPGKLIVDVVAKDKNGKITETFKSEFMVMAPVLPNISFARSTGGLIKKMDALDPTNMLEIQNYRSDLTFKIKSFEVTKKSSLSGVESFDSNKLNLRQLNIIKDLQNGDTFYITNIKIEDSKGKVYHVEDLGFIITE